MSQDWSQKSQLLYQMYRVNNAINTTFDAYISLSQSRFEILALIYQEIEISQGDLQKRVTLDKAAVARHLKQLEEQQLVVRRKKNGDNRMIWVQLTDLGKASIEASQKEKEYFANELLHQISDRELDTFQNILMKLDGNIARMIRDNE
ncbi:MarR family transcriptional regulator [Paenibacillus kandeliae]|uniref:MarR family transcriptional regulator n=1 Tax=Paenibacillus kandeliae TaxID=3231269 RepID=UPI003458AFA9